MHLPVLAHLLKVVPPVRPDGLLAAHVPHVELVALVLQRLDVESEGRLDGAYVVPVELLHDRRFSGVVKTPLEGRGGCEIIRIDLGIST